MVMIKKIFIVVFMFAFVANAQTKKPKTKTPPKTDSTGAIIEPEVPLDPMEALENSLPLEVELDPMTGKKIIHKDVKRRNDSLRAALKAELRKEKRGFWVRTKRPDKGKTGKTQLCMNIVSKDTNLVYCINDSICVDPEVYKVLYQKQVGDSAYLLIFVDAYSKGKNESGLCNAGHETKLFYTRWNTKTNSAKWKVKNIASCTKGITNMTKEPVGDWDKSSPLYIKYHRADFFYEIKFDPAQPQLGIQSVKDEEKDSKKEEAKKEE